MRKLKLTATSVAIALLTNMTPNIANAGGGGVSGGATEITQLMNNAELVMQLAESTIQTGELNTQTITAIQQLWHDIENIRSIGDKFSNFNEQSLLREVEALTGIRIRSNSMKGNLNQILSFIEQRQREAERAGLEGQDYAQVQADLINSNNENAILRLENEKRLIESLEDDHKEIQKFARQIPKNSGINQSIGLLNNQMNHSLKALSRIADLMGQANRNVEKTEEMSRQNRTVLSNQKILDEQRERAITQDEQLRAVRTYVSPQ